MAVCDSHMFPGFLTTVLTQSFFQSHQLLFSCASEEVRGKNMEEKKFHLNWVLNSQPLGHECDTLTTEPSGQG